MAWEAPWALGSVMRALTRFNLSVIRFSVGGCMSKPHDCTWPGAPAKEPRREAITPSKPWARPRRPKRKVNDAGSGEARGRAAGVLVSRELLHHRALQCRGGPGGIHSPRPGGAGNYHPLASPPRYHRAL